MLGERSVDISSAAILTCARLDRPGDSGGLRQTQSQICCARKGASDGKPEISTAGRYDYPMAGCKMDLSSA